MGKHGYAEFEGARFLAEDNKHHSIEKAKGALGSLLIFPAGIILGLISSNGNFEFFAILRYIFLSVSGAVVGGGIYSLLIYNILVSLNSKIESLKASFEASVNRKYDLQATLISLANTLSSEEGRIHGGIAKELRNAAGDLAHSQKPSILLANLAARFPQLNNVGGFMSAQNTASEIERKIDDDVRNINSELAAYNEIVGSIPSRLAAGATGFAKMDFVSSVGLEKEVRAESAD